MVAVLIFEEWKHEDKKEKSVGVTNDYELETSSTELKKKKKEQGVVKWGGGEQE